MKQSFVSVALVNKSFGAAKQLTKLTFRKSILVLLFALFSISGFAQNALDLAGLTSAAYSANAYSVRRLSTSYAGNLIKVRRSSDNTTSDIGFDGNGYLDTAALKTFVTSNSAFIDTWYDQSGNSHDMTQATTGSQPRIVNAGVIDRVNGLPAVYFNGSTYLATSSYTAFSSGFTTVISRTLLTHIILLF